MKPSPTIVFAVKSTKVNKELKKNNFEIVKQQPPRYQVIAIGDAVTSCQVGDHIIFTNSSVFTLNDQDVHTIEDADIRGTE